ncbi:globin [Phenylobacterium sp.]|uniref:globin n=1 Tax=Phenylobacterium sp. TaxID=1871053 RepID=UPI0035B30C9A
MAERAGDPAPAIYARLFAEFPEAEALFVRDTRGAVRGEMLAVAFQCLLDLDGSYGANFIAAERVNHEAFGVAPEAFGRFFPIVRDVCRELLAGDWTPEIDAAWNLRLARVGRLTQVEA